MFSKAVLVKTFVFLKMPIIDAQCMVEIQHRIGAFYGCISYNTCSVGGEDWT